MNNLRSIEAAVGAASLSPNDAGSFLNMLSSVRDDELKDIEELFRMHPFVVAEMVHITLKKRTVTEDGDIAEIIAEELKLLAAVQNS